jgi:AcrR family transcriptional regulator
MIHMYLMRYASHKMAVASARESPPGDRRVRRTRDALARALLELASEKPYEDVTVREVCDRADVAYATFFRHFASKEALVLQRSAEVVDALARLLEPVTDEGRLAEAGRRLFRYVREHRDELRVLFAAGRVSTIDRDLRDAVTARVLASPGFGPPSGLPRELAAHHLAVASMALVAWWLEHDMPYDATRMGRIYARLVVRPVRGG